MLSLAVRLSVLAALILGGGLMACGVEEDDPESSPTAEATFPPAESSVTAEAVTATPAAADSPALVAERPYRLREPDGLDRDKAAPLIIVLHGYGQGPEFEGYFHLGPVADQHGALLAYPLGTVDAIGRRFWNATDVCCDFFGRGVDDVAYIGAVIDDVSSRYQVDAKRVYVIGFSNGGFMAQRLACELSGRVAAAVSVAAVNWADPARCEPSSPVAVLQVHGDVDPVIHYLGGRMSEGGPPYPSVQASIEGWRDRNGCAPAPENSGQLLDVAENLDGAETAVEHYEDCAPGGAAELWTVHGGNHDVVFSDAFGEAVWSFFEEHVKP
jgi:polyhydroxybutyrate depolymerase